MSKLPNVHRGGLLTRSGLHKDNNYPKAQPLRNQAPQRLFRSIQLFTPLLMSTAVDKWYTAAKQ